MPLHIDDAAERVFAQIIGGLRHARVEVGISQNALSAGLPVRGRAISEWETRAVEPTLEHLILWCRELGLRLVIVGWEGEARYGPVRPRPGETQEIFDRRCLASPLRNRRQALGMSQGRLCELIGVTRDSIQRWELVRVPPRPIAHVVWAQRLGCSIALRPINTPTMRPRPYGVGRPAMPALWQPNSTTRHPSQL
ncbi:transcriptional regulator with XRE-family HTH domain [Catenulispora sp. EB89]|uniref:helix-turn-helix transcriptional regulator n=1 Tax=Catenulispora sp. EB89 TaxID=3156257 RepID=UPI0035134A10